MTLWYSVRVRVYRCKNRAHLSKLMQKGDLFRNFSLLLSADVRVEENGEWGLRA